jgi:hypothetical protein
VHEGDEPEALAHLCDADLLPGKDVAEIDLLALKADPAAVRHEDGVVVKRVRQVR